MKKTIQDFITFFEQHKEYFIDAVFSSPLSKSAQFKKISIRSILLKDKKTIQINSFTKTQCFTKNHAFFELTTIVSSLLVEYSQCSIRMKEELLYVHVDAEGFVNWKRKTEQNPLPTSSLHNRKKQYLIPEGTPIDFLVALDIMDAKGNVFREKYDKFKQVNQFVQHVFEIMDFEHDKEYRIVDFGCGKAILTFALAYLLREYNVQLFGIDLKKELLEKCQSLALHLGYKNLTSTQKGIIVRIPQNASGLVIERENSSPLLR